MLLPRRLVPAVEAIYAFARSADDLADEGNATPQERLAALDDYGARLDRIGRGERPDDPIFSRLADVVRDFGVPLAPMHDLLSAFRQDVVKTRYATYAELLDYCARSANPVGRLMLHLYGAGGAANLRDADAICSALQIINFLQDVRVDRAKDRIYLPLEDLERFAVPPEQLDRQVVDGAWRALMDFEVRRVRTLMESGAPLALRLPGRIGWELRLVVQGGLRILERIEQAGYDVFRHRPQLGAADWTLMLWRACWMRGPRR